MVPHRLRLTAVAATLVGAGCTSRMSAAPVPPPVATSAATASTATSPAAATQAAAEFVEASCPFDWREPFGTRESRASYYLTPAAASAREPTAETHATWQADVVASHAIATCQIRAAQALNETPGASTRRYVRVLAARHITRTHRPPADDDEPEYDLAVVYAGGRWLVDRAAPGG